MRLVGTETFAEPTGSSEDVDNWKGGHCALAGPVGPVKRVARIAGGMPVCQKPPAVLPVSC